MNDIFEPRSSSITNSFTSLNYELHLSIEQEELTPADASNYIVDFEDQDFIEFLYKYHLLSSAEWASYCLGFDDDIWDSLYPPASFYGFHGNNTESEWNRWYYGDICHKDQLYTDPPPQTEDLWVTNPFKAITIIQHQ